MFIFIIALKLLYFSCCYIFYPVFLCLRHAFAIDVYAFAIDVLLLKFYLSIKILNLFQSVTLFIILLSQRPIQFFQENTIYCNSHMNLKIR